MHRSGTTLLAIINDILDFSKIEAGKLDLECVGFDLLQVLEESLELFMEAGRAKLELTQQIDERVPRYLKGDPVRFRQILMNLLSNAMKFTEIGGITWSLNFEWYDHPRKLHFPSPIPESEFPPQPSCAYLTPFPGGRFHHQTIRWDRTRPVHRQTVVALMGGAITVESEPGEALRSHFPPDSNCNHLAQDPKRQPSHAIRRLAHSYLVPDHALWAVDASTRSPGTNANRMGQAAGCILLAEDSPVNREAVGMLETRLSGRNGRKRTAGAPGDGRMLI